MKHAISKEELSLKLKRTAETFRFWNKDREAETLSWMDRTLAYEPYRKQLENWNNNNKKDDVSKYFEVLETLKKNDKIPGLICQERSRKLHL